MSSKYESCKKKPKEPTRQPPPTVPIADMLEIAEGIYRETGHYPSFGEVQVGIDAGKIHPEDYLNGRRAE